MKTKKLSRRAVLRGAGGIAIALPFLDIMRPSQGLSNPGAAPKRLILLSTPNGTIADRWFPDPSQIGGSDIQLSPILAPLERHKQDINILLGMDNKAEVWGHLRGMSSMFTGRKTVKAGNQRNATGASLDQHVAHRWTQDEHTRTPYSSLVLGTKKDYKLSTQSISYSKIGTPMPKIALATTMFDRLFGAQDDSAQRLRKTRASILDSVSDDLTRVNASLGREDRQRMDLHLTSLRELELRLSQNYQVIEGFEPGTARDHGSALHEIIPQMFDVLELALVCDLSRAVSFCTRSEGATSAYTFGWLGIGPPEDPFAHDTTDNATSYSHHSMSHNEHTDRNRDYLTTVGAYFMQEWAGLIDRLKARQDADGSSIFDNTIILQNSPIARGAHNCVDLPLLVMAGSKSGIKTGQYLNFRSDGSTDFGGMPHKWGQSSYHRKGRSINDLYLSVLHALGFEDETSFGDPEHCSGVMDELLV